MTDFIYRGIIHTGATAPAPRVGAELRYRGVAHHGLRAATPSSAARMFYRGIHYIAQADTAPDGPTVAVTIKTAGTEMREQEALAA